MPYVGFNKNLIKALAFLINILSNASFKDKSALDEILSLLPSPRILDLNTERGNIINPVKGISLYPIINALGNTVKTVLHFPARGNVKDPGNSVKFNVILITKYWST